MGGGSGGWDCWQSLVLWGDIKWSAGSHVVSSCCGRTVFSLEPPYTDRVIQHIAQLQSPWASDGLRVAMRTWHVVKWRERSFLIPLQCLQGSFVGSMECFCEEGILKRPSGVCFDSEGNLYVTSLTDEVCTQSAPLPLISALSLGQSVWREQREQSVRRLHTHTHTRSFASTLTNLL